MAGWNGAIYLSRFTFMASDYQLPEVNYSGVIELTVKDLKEMNPRPQSFWNLDELPDDCKALYIPDENDTGGLSVSLCTNPPDGLENYVKKEYIYWLNGKFRMNKCINQLLEYLHSNINEGGGIELWSLWFGDEMDNIVHHKWSLSQTNNLRFELLEDTDCCLRIIK